MLERKTSRSAIFWDWVSLSLFFYSFFLFFLFFSFFQSNIICSCHLHLNLEYVCVCVTCFSLFTLLPRVCVCPTHARIHFEWSVFKDVTCHMCYSLLWFAFHFSFAPHHHYQILTFHFHLNQVIPFIFISPLSSCFMCASDQWKSFTHILRDLSFGFICTDILCVCIFNPI